MDLLDLAEFSLTAQNDLAVLTGSLLRYCAWDALAYDKYETGSREEGLAGSLLQSYYGETKEPTIKLTNPKQVLLLDAMAEAAGVPHQRGQTEITIPEKLRKYNQYLMSSEYEELWKSARARRNR